MISPLDFLSIESWILIGSLIFLARYYIKHRWSRFEKLQIPFDPPSFYNLGSLNKLIGKESGLVYENECKEKYGKIWGCYEGLHAAITIHDPDILRQIYIKEFSNFPDRDKRLIKIGGKELNNALTSVTGKQWKRIRSTMTPSFSSLKLKQMMSIVEWCADNAVDVLNRKIKNNDGVFDTREAFTRLSLDMVCSAAFSTKVDSQDDTVEEPEISKKAKQLFNTSFLNPWLILCNIFPPFEKFLGAFNIPALGGDTFAYFTNLTNHLIGKRHENSHAQTPGRVDFMQSLLDAEIPDNEAKEDITKGMTRTEIIGNSLVMILASYENTGNTMSYMAYNFAQHPEIQIQVQKEIDQMYWTHGKFDYEGVNSLKLLDMCMHETFRLYMPEIRNTRFAENEITINGLTIPAGMQINIPSYALAHDPDYWTDPYEFKPERMRDMSQVDPMYFQPFGAGPRNCIGMRFAVMQVKICLTKLLFNFSFKPAENTPNPPLKLQFGISVRPFEDLYLKVVSRKTKK